MNLKTARSMLVPAITLALLSTQVWSAPRVGQQPALHEQQQIGDSIMLPTPNLAQAKFEDSKAVGGPYRYGVQVAVSTNMKSGRWTRLDDGRMRWSMSVIAPEATSLDFHFSKLALPKGSLLRIVGEGDGNERKIQADEVRGGEFWTPYVLGEKARIEIDVDARLAGRVVAELASATHGYRGLFERTQEKSGSCNVDTICPAGDTWRDQIDSVGHYTFSSGGSSYVCTGTLIGNTTRDTTPYFLTANHCVSTATVAGTIVVYWNYQSSTCRTPGSASSGTSLSKSIATHSQSGTTLVSTNAASDFALLRLNSNVPSGANPYWSGWDATGTAPTSAVGIHHPAGHEKRIAVENNALTVSGYSGAAGTSHWRVNDWDAGTTEGGSSGSGLWNQNKRLVGQLHGGSAACGNDLSDYYGRLSVSWAGGGSNATRLSNWLSPSGVTTLDGYRGGTTGNVAPTANYTFTTSGLTATFTDSSSDSDGTIASRSWNFGDGTTSTATSPSKTYTTGGTYNVALTVTDNGGLTNTRTQSVTVTASGGGGTTLTNGVAATNLGAATGASLNYTMVVPAGASNLRFATTGGTGDLDMYVKFGSAPTDTVYDCRPYASGNAETCNIATAQAGTYYVRLKAYSTFAGVSLTGSYTTGGAGGAQTYSNGTDVTIGDNTTVNSPIAVSGRSGNAPSNASVTVAIVHTYQGDLKVDLVAPDGTLYNIHNRTGGGTDNINKTVTLNLSTEALNGTWNLRVNDNASGDTGYINSWSVTF
ncbi:MAG: proprotein convertase P-domain-containing protein [Ahniella sp.]|nr:proprotein convertase P-domain-containing protein [Ahniella sp.]